MNSLQQQIESIFSCDTCCHCGQNVLEACADKGFSVPQGDRMNGHCMHPETCKDQLANEADLMLGIVTKEKFLNRKESTLCKNNWGYCKLWEKYERMAKDARRSI